VAAEKDASGGHRSHGGDCGTKSFLIPIRTSAWRRALRPRLAKGKIAAEHGRPGPTECIGQHHQQRRFAIGAGPVSQHETVLPTFQFAVNKSFHSEFLRIVVKLAVRAQSH
jgi:hypothetical protein